MCFSMFVPPKPIISPGKDPLPTTLLMLFVWKKCIHVLLSMQSRIFTMGTAYTLLQRCFCRFCMRWQFLALDGWMDCLELKSRFGWIKTYIFVTMTRKISDLRPLRKNGHPTLPWWKHVCLTTRFQPEMTWKRISGEFWTCSFAHLFKRGSKNRSDPPT